MAFSGHATDCPALGPCRRETRTIDRRQPGDRDVRLIVNPRSGARQGRRHARQMQRLLAAGGARVHATFSRAHGDVRVQVRDAVRAGFRNVVVAGGDGSLHEAVNGLLPSDGDVALGLIPLGTGNDFAKAVGIGRDWRSACHRIVECLDDGSRRIVDAGRCNDFYFANGVGIGFDARVTEISESLKWLPGPFAYAAALLVSLVGGIAQSRAQLRVDGSRLNAVVSMIVVCNGPWLGGVFHIAPDASNDDGTLKLLLATPLSRRHVLRIAPAVMRGKHYSSPLVRHVGCRTLSVELETPLAVEADGEIRYRQQRSLSVEVLPGALRLLA